MGTLTALPLQHLAGGIAAQGVDELHVPRHLEPGQPLSAVRGELFSGDRRPRLEDEKALGTSPPPRIGNANNRRLHHRGMLVQRALHLRGGDVLPTRDDEVLLSVLDVEVAVLIDPPNVAGVEPTLPDGSGRRLQVRPVPLDTLGRRSTTSPNWLGGTPRPSSSTTRTARWTTGLSTEPMLLITCSRSMKASPDAVSVSPYTSENQALGKA